MRKFILLALALTVAVAASASSIMDGQRVTTGTRPNHSGDIVGGWYPTDSTGRYLKFDQNGNLMIRDADPPQDYSTVKNLIEAQSLAPGTSATSAAAVALGEYTSLLVMVSFNCAAADTDSTALGISFTGKISTDVNDGFDFIVSAAGDSGLLARADTTGAGSPMGLGSVVAPAPNVFIIAKGKSTFGGAAGAATPTRGPMANPYVYELLTNSLLPATRTRPYRVPPSKIVWSDGHYGACFMLQTPNGVPFKFSHLMVSVQNLNRLQTYTNVKVDVWPKVN